jgi:hypothetical protein
LFKRLHPALFTDNRVVLKQMVLEKEAIAAELPVVRQARYPSGIATLMQNYHIALFRLLASTKNVCSYAGHNVKSTFT